MGTSTKYILASIGKNTPPNISLSPLLKSAEYILKDTDYSFFINEKYSTGIPERIIWLGNIGILLHGIVFPRNSNLDTFASDPDRVLREILEKHTEDLHNIPYEFISGSYVGFVIDKEKKTFYAFTSFLNSIPLYYCDHNDSLLISTDLNRLAKISGKTINQITNGIIEYYHLGTNLSECTGIDGIYAIPKGAYVCYDGSKVTMDYYYRFPSQIRNLSFDDAVAEFKEIWEKNLKALTSKKFRSGLGLTGGVDSRLIFAGWPDQNSLITYTGSHKLHPDYLLARQLTGKIQASENHNLENYSHSDKLKGYAETLLNSDNPLMLNAVFFTDQFLFRKSLGLTYEFIGLTEFLGGVYHYISRSSLAEVFKMIMPVRYHSISNESADSYFSLIKMGLRDHIFEEINGKLTDAQNSGYHQLLQEMITQVRDQMNSGSIIETFLERFRHTHKMANLLTWSRLVGRSYNEMLSPSLNIEMTDFAACLPLKYRDNRKLLLTYLKRYHPELSSIVLTGSILSAKHPWIFHKLLNPFIKSFNALGYRIPYYQWYLKYRKSQQNLQDTAAFSKFQHSVCEDSSFLQSNYLGSLYEEYKTDSKRLWRLFNIVMLERRINLCDEEYSEFVYKHLNHAKSERFDDFNH